MSSEEIISLTEFKSDASAWVERLQSQPPVVLTQNGRGRAVVQSYESYRQMQDSMAMLAIVARGEADVQAGGLAPQAKVFADLRRELAHVGASRSESKKTGPRSKRRA